VTLKPYTTDRYPALGILNIEFEVDDVIKGSATGIDRIEGWAHYRLRRLVDPPIELDSVCEASDIEPYLPRLNVLPVLLNGVERLPALRELWFEEARHRWDGGPVATQVLLREPHEKQVVLTMTPERLETLQ